MLAFNSRLPCQTSWILDSKPCTSMPNLNLALLGLLSKEEFVLLISLSILSSRFIPDVTALGISFPLKPKSILLYGIRYILFIHPSFNGRVVASVFGYFRERYEYPLKSPLSFSFMDVSKSGIAGSYGSSIFNFVRNYHTVFLGGWASFVPTEGAQRFNFPTTSPTPILVAFFPGFSEGGGGIGKEWAMLMGMTWALQLVIGRIFGFCSTVFTLLLLSLRLLSYSVWFFWVI